MTIGKITIIINIMKEPICKTCKYFNGQCQNYNLTRAGKKKRKNGLPCEFWEAPPEVDLKELKAKLLDIAIQLEKVAYSLNGEEK